MSDSTVTLFKVHNGPLKSLRSNGTRQNSKRTELKGLVYEMEFYQT